MRVWVVEYGEFADDSLLGVFSSQVRAEEAKDDHKRRYEDYHYRIWENEIDKYWNDNCTKLHKALK